MLLNIPDTTINPREPFRSKIFWLRFFLYICSQLKCSQQYTSNTAKLIITTTQQTRNVGSMLARCLQRRKKMNVTLGQRHVGSFPRTTGSGVLDLSRVVHSEAVD